MDRARITNREYVNALPSTPLNQQHQALTVTRCCDLSMYNNFFTFSRVPISQSQLFERSSSDVGGWHTLQAKKYPGYRPATAVLIAGGSSLTMGGGGSKIYGVEHLAGTMLFIFPLHARFTNVFTYELILASATSPACPVHNCSFLLLPKLLVPSDPAPSTYMHFDRKTLLAPQLGTRSNFPDTTGSLYKPLCINKTETDDNLLQTCSVGLPFLSTFPRQWRVTRRKNGSLRLLNQTGSQTGRTLASK